MRISTTTIESFRLWSDPEQEWMTEAELQATIRGEFRPTHNVLVGQAFDKILEAPEQYAVCGGYRYQVPKTGEIFEFGWDVVDPCLQVFDRRGVWQVKGVKAYGDDDVVAVADQIVGAAIIENKTTLSTFDFEKYALGCQWRFEVEVFQPVSVTYHVFALAEACNGVISLRDIHTFTLYPYAALHQDCCELLDRFRRYVHARGLEDVLHAAQRRAAAALELSAAR